MEWVHAGLRAPGPALPSASSEPLSALLLPSGERERPTSRWCGSRLRAMGPVLSRVRAEHRARRVSGSQPEGGRSALHRGLPRGAGPEDSPRRVGTRPSGRGSRGAPRPAGEGATRPSSMSPAGATPAPRRGQSRLRTLMAREDDSRPLAGSHLTRAGGRRAAVTRKVHVGRRPGPSPLQRRHLPGDLIIFLKCSSRCWFKHSSGVHTL